MTPACFRDHFSTCPENYRQFRPTYPAALFGHLRSLVATADTAWDCAAGSGQAAAGLARHFRRVVATDASRRQLRSGIPAPNMLYAAALAEEAPLQAKSLDLITVAQALHWFDMKPFFAEARRVLKEDGLLAVWSYNLFSLPARELNEIIAFFYGTVLQGYWPAERRLVENGYRDIPFPFTRLACPHFAMTAELSLPELTGYLGTWSAVQAFQRKNGTNPLDIIKDELARRWGDPDGRLAVSWPLTVLLGKKEP